MKNKFVLEIGANQGIDTINLYNKYNLPVIAVEPTPELLFFLWKKYENNSDIKILPLAIDLERGFKKFNVAGSGDWGCSSLHDFNPDIHNLWNGRPDFNFTHFYNVMCITGEDLINFCNIEEVEYLWIDTQGNDLRVLKSFKDKLSIVKSGKCEAAYTVELYNNINNNYKEIENYLQLNGFKTWIQPDVVNKECDVYFERI